MSAPFAERERKRHGLDDGVEIVTAGTYSTDSVHREGVDAMAELDIDPSDREPREVDPEELEAGDVASTMGSRAGRVRRASLTRSVPPPFR